MKILREGQRPVRDYTTKRVGTRSDRGRRIERCPDCGRKGEATTYRGGDRNFAHKAEFDGIMWSIVDSCYVPA